MWFSVTSRDIKGAKRLDPEKCPIARCVKRTLKTKRIISVNNGSLYAFICVDYSSSNDTILPSYVGQRIQSFDRGGVMKPFRFQIKNPLINHL